MAEMHRLAVLLAMFAATASAQNQPDFRADVTLATIPVLVTDGRGEPVRDLKANDFRVYDNGAPTPVSDFWLEDQLPLTIGIISDISVSQRAFLREHQAAIDAFLTKLLRAGDRAFVVAVNEDATLQAEYAGGPERPRQILPPRGPEPFGSSCITAGGGHLCGGTALWNAVYESAHRKLADGAHSAPGSKALLILSDGNDTGSLHHFPEALAEVERAGAIVYAIRYGTAAEDDLARLVAQTGGAEFEPPRGDYRQALERIERDLRSQYVLAFHAATEGPSTRSLRVEVARPGLIVRARKQYTRKE